jgi:hypothetical protein
LWADGLDAASSSVASGEVTPTSTAPEFMAFFAHGRSGNCKQRGSSLQPIRRWRSREKGEKRFPPIHHVRRRPDGQCEEKKEKKEKKEMTTA